LNDFSLTKYLHLFHHFPCEPISKCCRRNERHTLPTFLEVYLIMENKLFITKLGLRLNLQRLLIRWEYSRELDPSLVASAISS
jgi:hypothetical protein